MINVRARSVIERWLAVIGSIPDNGLSHRPTGMAGQRLAEPQEGATNIFCPRMRSGIVTL
jgi:hypothetical protein